jgi:hypothetical protein
MSMKTEPTTIDEVWEGFAEKVLADYWESVKNI